MSRRSAKGSLAALEAHWYAVLKREGFEDIEDHAFPHKPLKRWSGMSLTGSGGSTKIVDTIDLVAVQAPLEDVSSSFPESVFQREEALLNSPEFPSICASIRSHGNHSLTITRIRKLWAWHVAGETSRAIAKKIRANHVTVHRCIVTLTKWANIMGQDETKEVSIVVIRKYDEHLDAPVLFATWRNALWFDEKRGDEHNEKFFREASRRIRNLIRHPDTQVRIACLSDDPGLILGYAVMQGDNLEWVYVKADYRTRGVAKLLCKGFKTISQPQTKLGRLIAQEKKLEIKN